MLGNSTIRLLVADGSRFHTQLLVEALRRDSDLLVAPFELDSSSLVAALKAQNVDVLLLSSTLDEQPGRGFELLRELRSSLPKLRVVMLLDSSADEAVLSAFRAGARGVVSRTESVHTLNDCVRHIHDGNIWANHRQLTIAIEALAAAPVVRAVNAKGMSLLSKRELQIVRSLAEGLTNREIAERLKLSQHTVKNYLFRVFDKLGVSSRVELLFMTLADSSVQPPQRRKSQAGIGDAGNEFSVFLKAAENGLPLLQLAVAQVHIALQKEPQDLVQAYAWSLLAEDRESHTKEQIGTSMTAPQIEEARQQARGWIARLQELGTPPEAAVPAKPLRRADAAPPTAARTDRHTEGRTAGQEHGKAKAAHSW
jgi:two-component system, NarL family, nitrate/nitrite response regulator NarL